MKAEDSYLCGKHIMLVDDELELLRMATSILRSEGFSNLSVFSNSLEAKTFCAEHAGGHQQPELLILDVMMPELDGFSLLSDIRRISALSTVPVIFLTAKDEAYNKISGLGLGADDYITKPFLPQELVLRVIALLRRSYADEQPALELAASSVDLAKAEVYREDETIMLTAKEHEILSVLARNMGRIVTFDALCEACWGNSFGNENTLMAHIRRLRGKIEADPSNPQSLITVKGLGYKLVVGLGHCKHANSGNGCQGALPDQAFKMR